MSMTLQIHNIVGIELLDISTDKLNENYEYSVRRIVFTCRDFSGTETKQEITLFADNGHSLLVDDAILADMKLPFELKEAA